jgi:hypothetical protein
VRIRFASIAPIDPKAFERPTQQQRKKLGKGTNALLNTHCFDPHEHWEEGNEEKRSLLQQDNLLAR